MNDIKKIVKALAEDISTPRSLAVHLMLKYGEYNELVQLRTDPKNYLTAWSYMRDATFSELLRKCSGLKTGIDTAKVAEAAFWEAEKACAKTNARLAPHILKFYPEGVDERLIEFTRHVRRKIKQALGPCPEFSHFDGKFGKGSVLETSEQRTHVLDKLSGIPTLTPSALKCIPDWAKTAWAENVLRNGGEITLVDGNRFSTVPKNATTDRGIGVEPSINGFYQLAVGSFLKKRLAKLGLDLIHGQQEHCRLAAQSSRDDSLVTIDLSAASDTVAYNLVRLLIPDDWFELLDTLRSPFTYVKGRRVHLSKFSSMGNGYTFELETLIFWALCDTLREVSGVEGRINVYGDDIIAPSALKTALSPMLAYFGFSVNLKKSFFEGPFRESCGGDFFNGVPVRAHYIKEIPREPHEYISLANGLRRLGCQDNRNGCLDPHYLRAWKRIVSLIPKSARLYGPEHLGDTVIHAGQDKWERRVTRDGICEIRTWAPVDHEKVALARWDDDTVLAGLLYGSKPNYAGSIRPIKLEDWNDPRKLSKYREGFHSPYMLRRDSVLSYGRKWVAL